MIAISDNLQIRKDVPSGTIIINRPNRRNALARDLISAIREALEDLHQELNVRAVILTGTGNTFCSGSDLHELKESAEAPNAMEIWHEDTTQFQELIEYMLRYPKPIIAAVNGWAVGSGVALMAAADVVVASENAQVMIPEARRGLNAGLTAPLLSFRIGTGYTTKLLFSGLPIQAPEALNMGLVHELVDDDLVWARCQQLAVECAAGARQSHLLSKQMIYETIGENLFDQLSIGAANTASARTTDAALEGINAFLEKREPVW